jgi:hypothetical protein
MSLMAHEERGFSGPRRVSHLVERHVVDSDVVDSPGTLRDEAWLPGWRSLTRQKGLCMGKGLLSASRAVYVSYTKLRNGTCFGKVTQRV